MAKRYRPGSNNALIHEVILRGLQDGTYPPGSLMPYGIYFAAEYGVSVHTVKNVMRGLVEDGWLIPRGRGKEHRVHPQPPTGESSG